MKKVFIPALMCSIALALATPAGAAWSSGFNPGAGRRSHQSNHSHYAQNHRGNYHYGHRPAVAYRNTGYYSRPYSYPYYAPAFSYAYAPYRYYGYSPYYHGNYGYYGYGYPGVSVNYVTTADPDAPGYALGGAILGGVLGGVIGNNSGSRNGWAGAAIGSTIGLIAGSAADSAVVREQRARRAAAAQQQTLYNDSGADMFVPQAPAPDQPQAQPAQNTGNYRNNASPMSQANALFGR